MKRTVRHITLIAIFLVACTAGVQAQHYFGMRGGYGTGSARLEPERGFENESVGGMLSGGVGWKYYSSEAFVGGVAADMLYMQQGFRTVTRNYETGDRVTGYERHVNTVMMPICWQPHVYMPGQRLRVFLNAGVTFSYVLDSTETDITYVDGVQTARVTRPYTMTLTRDNRFGYGLCGGGGMSWSAGRLEIFGEARFYLGYSDILKNRNKNETNPHMRSPLDGLQLSAGVFWRLGSGGIKSAQGRRN
ncbi:MAG: outer membrane beta-barrel protein [Rikenellaceae bacterium]|nr:outer membrane beta-barrel protein [Rikenellaceae bacterium]MCL2693418.1 outer membrane beta-barrel protein [Rikenellaceae bacterium]